MFVNILLNVMGVLMHTLMGCYDIYNWIYGLHVDHLGLFDLFILFYCFSTNIEKEKSARWLSRKVCETGILFSLFNFFLK